MQKAYKFFMVFVTSCALSVFLFCAKPQEIEKITILHWNDFHASALPHQVSDDDEGLRMVSGSAYFSAYLDSLKAKNENVILVCAGDEVVGTPMSTLSKGRVEFEILNMIGPDVFELGNHEFDFGLENLNQLIKLAQFPIICANVIHQESGHTLVPSYLILEKGKAKVAFIGVNTEALKEVVVEEATEGLEIGKARETLEALLPDLEKKSDIQVLVSHMGFNEDKRIAREVKGIEVIIGGHSHTRLLKPEVINQTIICQAGSNGRYIGRLNLVVDIKKDRVVNYEGGLIETVNDKVTPDSKVQTRINEFEETYGKVLDQVIGQLKTSWTRTSGESNLGNWTADVMREYTGSDVAFVNSGALRKDLPEGPVTVRDIWEINPFSDRFVSFDLSGEELLNVLEINSSGDYELMQVSGLTYTYDPEKPKGQKVVRVLVHGQPLVAEKKYKVTINDYMLGHSDKFLGIAKEDLKYEIHPGLDRDVYIQAVKDQKVIHSKIEGRIKGK